MRRWDAKKPVDAGTEKKLLKPLQAARLVDKNARTIVKMMHILVR